MKTKQLDPTKLLDPTGRERRFVTVTDLEIRADDEGKSTFEGHAAVFDAPADIGGYFREEIAKGAFKKTIKEADVRALINHNPDLIFARNKAGTLHLAEDDIGLFTRADLDRRITYVNDLAISLERGDVSQMSFGFRVIEDEWRKDGEEVPEWTFGATRRVKQAQLFDVSTVTYPAYVETDAALRSQVTSLVSALDLTEEQRAELMTMLERGEQIDLSTLRAGEAPPEQTAPPEPAEGHSLSDWVAARDREHDVHLLLETGA